MSRSYRKYIRFFACFGRNTPYYKIRRRIIRHKINHEINELLNVHGVEGLNDLWIGSDMKTEDQYSEPTDGHWKMNKELLKIADRVHGYNDYYHKYCDKYLKKKRRCHK